MNPGWWRRNRWGLLLVVPALALALYSPVKDGYAGYWKAEPRRPVSGAPGGWVAFDGARMRLERLAVDSAPPDFDGEPVAVPTGTQAWKATIDFDVPSKVRLTGCTVALEASTGTTFSPGPQDLKGLDTPFDYCTPEDPDDKSARYQTVAYFLLPRQAHPVALRVSVRAKLPVYARLTPP